MSSTHVVSSMAPGSDPDDGRLRTRPVRRPPPPVFGGSEQAVLAAMMIDTDAVMRASEIGRRHNVSIASASLACFRGMQALTERRDVVDPLTLADELARRGELEPAAGATTSQFPSMRSRRRPTGSSIHAPYSSVREKALLRRLNRSLDRDRVRSVRRTHGRGRVARRGRSTGSCSSGRSGAAFDSHGSRSCSGPPWSASRRCPRAGKSITGVASGFADLDEITSASQPSDLVIVAARPAMGKTAFCLGLAQHAAIEHNIPIALFSLEMSRSRWCSGSSRAKPASTRSASARAAAR